MIGFGKMFTRGLLLQAAAAILAVAAAGCSTTENEIDTEPSESEATLTVKVSTLDCEAEGEEVKISVTSNREWSFEASDEWIHGTKGDGSLTITVDPNDEWQMRSGSIEIMASADLRHTVTVRQLGVAPAILLSEQRAEVAAEGGELTVKVTANVRFEVVTDAEWISRAENSRAEMTVSECRLVVGANGSEDERTAAVVFRSAEEDEAAAAEASLTVVQEGMPADDEMPGLPEDVKVAVARAEGPKASQGQGIELSYDGRADTYYYTENYVPSSQVFYYFDNAPQIDYMVYHPHSMDSHGMGCIQDVDIDVLCGDGQWKRAASASLGGSKEPSTIIFGEPMTGVKTVRLTVKSASGYVLSIAEAEFWSYRIDEFDVLQLFTDRSCSELRAGVTEADVEACTVAFYRAIARRLLNGTYPEFRTATAHARQHPDVQRAEYKTNAYSLLDNPTGMAVEAGEQITLLVDMHGEKAQLCVMNCDKGFGSRQVYQLTTGLNRLTMSDSGLAYIMYHTNNYATAPEVRVNFVDGGTVNGYYDRCNPAHEGRWKELLEGAQHKFFDVVGRYAHLVYETEQFRTQTADLDHLIRIYDEIVYREQIFFGLMRNRDKDEMFTNRMMFRISYGSQESQTIMFVEEYYIGVISPVAFPDYATDDTTLCSSYQSWTIAHELGHSHQVKPFLRWPNMVEITNNIMSQYITRSVFGGESRISVNDGFAEAWSQVIAKRASYHSICNAYSDSAIVPFWQLELYFGNVLGRTPRLGDFIDDTEHTDPASLTDDEYKARYDGFYPRLYELIRQFEQQNNGAVSGLQYQAQFALLASRAAGMDLSDFFGKWGFFKGTSSSPADSGYLDPEYAERVKSQIKALGLEPPADAIEYISDNNWQSYKERRKVNRAGFYSLGHSPFHVIIENETNAVAYEICDSADGNRLVAVGEIGFYDYILLPEEWRGTFRVYAVQYDGERIELMQR